VQYSAHPTHHPYYGISLALAILAKYTGQTDRQTDTRNSA